MSNLATLYAFETGLIISDVLPSPADAIYLYLNRKYNKQLENGQITAKQYWVRELLIYYGLNPLWWALVLGLTIATKGTNKDKIKIAAGLVGTGAVIGVIAKNIQNQNKT
jgi:hypothetical protein